LSLIHKDFCRKCDEVLDILHRGSLTVSKGLSIDSVEFRGDPNPGASLSRRPLDSPMVPGKSMAKSATRTTDRAMRMNRPWRRKAAFSFTFVPFVALLTALSHAQTTSIRIPSATPLSVELLQHVPMKMGESLQGRLLYPIYVDNQIALPAGAVLRGRVVQLDSDRDHRIHSRLRGDFTPFHTPVVRFDQLVLPDGTPQAIVADNAKDGVPLLQLSPPPGTKKRSFIARQLDQAKQRLKAGAALVTAPGRGDRFVQFVYSQLPYHPERIETGTSWNVELAQPLELTFSPPKNGGEPMTSGENKQTAKEKPDAITSEDRAAWRLHAYLQQTISSANKKVGDTFQAVVAEPVFNLDHSLVVPQGSVLVGEITQAKTARSFGRQGKLRFHFKELRLPSGFSQPVEARLSGIDSNKSANLQIDSEGGIQPQSQNRVVVPLVLTLLAGRAFDEDGNRTFNSAIGSNSLGVLGRLAGVMASSRNIAGSIGVYGALLAFYDLWLVPGHNVVFVKNTRIEVTTTSNRSPLRVSNVEQRPAPSR
jgi:hypothetical protein